MFFKILKEIGAPILEKLKNVIAYFNKYKIAAEKNPGGYQNGNIIIGADPDQYYPSEEELLVSELGKMIKIILDSNLNDKIDRFKISEGIQSQTIEFNEIFFRHVDVMGSGRFFYASKQDPETKIRV